MSKVTHRQILAFIWRYVRRHLWVAALMLILLGANIMLTLSQPFFYRSAVDIMGSDPVPGAAARAVLMIALGVLTGALSLTCHELASFLLGYMETRILPRVHGDVFAKVQRLSTKFHVSSFAGATARKIGRGVDGVESAIDKIWFSFLPLAVFTVGLMAVLTVYAPVIGWAMLAGIILYGSFSVWLNLRLRGFYSWADEQDTRLSASMVDAITGNSLVKTFGAEPREDVRHGGVLSEWQRRWWISWRLSNFFTWLQFMGLMIIELAVLLLTVYLWSTGRFTPGGFVVVLFYVGQLWGRLHDIGRNMRDYLKAIAHCEEMVGMYMQPLGVDDMPGAKPLEVRGGAIRIENVTFRYEPVSNPIFQDFFLAVAPGEKVAIVGHSGGGKSTLIKLLLRLYDVEQGAIYIDDQNIAEVTQASLRQSIGLVPQDPILFHRSVAENISYAKADATPGEIEEAAKKAHAHEFIAVLPHGYDTLVGERGVKLSGGERQRVAIARAILADKPILVLDEATSSLDSISESYIQDALQYLMHNRTTIVIAHRLSTIKSADRIVVIDDGNVVEEGSHDALVQKPDGRYRHLYELQAGGFIGQ